MCRFFSVIVSKNGEIYHNDFTDSHEDLIDIYNLHGDDKIQSKWVRIEFVPQNPCDLETYKLNIDDEKPAWWNDTFETKIIKKLKAILKPKILTEGVFKILCGGMYILGGNAKINKVVNCNVQSVSGSAQIESVSGSAQIKSVSGSAQIEYVYGSAQIKSVSGSAQIIKDATFLLNILLSN
ncbi:MAG: hypothetical protein MUE91_07325 [Ignavibacteriaceae bacterium]|nr:hypothetical protein [Ignavibacteriaceae bacterium]